MHRTGKWSRVVMVIGFAGMLLGAVDPLEGSVVILAGAAMLAFEARLGQSRHAGLLGWSFGLLALGVGLLFGISAIGGFGGRTGRSMWWALILLPYPIGWLMGLVGGVRRLREGFGGNSTVQTAAP
jgi:hypothetical protein